MLLSYNHKVEDAIVHIYSYDYNRTKCTHTHGILSSVKFLQLLLLPFDQLLWPREGDRIGVTEEEKEVSSKPRRLWTEGKIQG